MATKNAFTRWLDTFLSEKGVEMMTPIVVEGPVWGENHMKVQTVVDAIKVAPAHEQAAIKTMIVKIDFHNGDVVDYFKHLAKALAK